MINDGLLRHRILGGLIAFFDFNLRNILLFNNFYLLYLSVFCKKLPKIKKALFWIFTFCFVLTLNELKNLLFFQLI